MGVRFGRREGEFSGRKHAPGPLASETLKARVEEG